MNTKILPLVAIMSGLLVGCSNGDDDSSSGGSGGGTTPSTTTYTFNFYKPTVVDAASSSTCTLYNLYEEDGEDKALIYESIVGNIDNDIFAIYSNADGIQVGQNLHAVNGKLSIALEDIPDDGFVTIQEDGGTIINAVSFSKELIESQSSLRSTSLSTSLRAETGSCITGGNDVENTLVSQDFYNADDAIGTPHSTYYFSSQIDELESTNSRILPPGIEYRNNESVFVTQYLDEEKTQLFQYGFSDWSDSTLSFAKNVGDVNTDFSGIEFTNVQLELIQNGYFYPVTSIDVTAGADFEFYYPDESQGEVWSYNSSGDIVTEGWSAEYTGVIDTQDTVWYIDVNDLSLFDVTQTNDSKPTTNLNEIDLTSSLAVDDESGLMRVAYNQGSTPYAVTHVIYSYINSTVIAPELDLTYVPSDQVDELRVSDDAEFTQSYVITENDSDVPLESFMTMYRNGEAISSTKDALGLVKSIKEIREHDVNMSQVKNLYLTRFN